MPGQWQHNLYLIKQEAQFYTWLKEVEARLGRKGKAVDRVAALVD